MARFLGPARRQTSLWFPEASPFAVFVLIWSALHQKIEHRGVEAKNSILAAPSNTRHGSAIEKLAYSNLAHSPKLIHDLLLHGEEERSRYQKRIWRQLLKWNFYWGWWCRKGEFNPPEDNNEVKKELSSAEKSLLPGQLINHALNY